MAIVNHLQLINAFKMMDGFMTTLAERAREGRPDDVPLPIWQAQNDALVSVMMGLRGEIADYLEARPEERAIKRGRQK